MSTAPLPTIEAMTAFVRRNLALLVVLTLLGGVLGWVVAAARPDRYVASATVLLPIPPQRENRPAPEPESLDTLARLAWSQPVVTAVADATELDEPDVPDRIAVSAVPLSRLLVVRFTGDSAAQARLGAQTTARELIRERREVFSDGGSIAQAAQRPDGPVRANVEVFVVSGALLGLLLATGVATAREGLSRRPERVLRRENDRQAAVGDPLLWTGG